MASFLVPDIFPIIFMVEKGVYFDIWNFKKNQNFQPNPNLKNEQNPSFEKVKKKIFFPNIKMYTFFHHKNDGGKCLALKMKPQ